MRTKEKLRMRRQKPRKTRASRAKILSILLASSNTSDGRLDTDVLNDVYDMEGHGC